MKKVLVIFTAQSFGDHVLKFATGMAKQHNWLLSGVFLDDTPPTVQYPFPNDLSFTAAPVSEKEVVENEQLVLDNIQVFKNYCAAASVQCEEVKDIGYEQLTTYSAEASLMIIDARIRFNRYSLTDLLTNASCPVCLVSTAAAEPQHIILAYDGSKSAKYAIEKFITVFPKLDHLPAFLVSINPELELLEHKEFINQTLPDRFKNYTLKFLRGKVKEEMDNFVKQYPAAMVVMGAFGRSGLSRLFHPSLANELLAETEATVFIAHE
jgi:nucleotide-binding universal stress UspA family protein